MTAMQQNESKTCPYCLSMVRSYVRYGGNDYYRCDRCDLIFEDSCRDEIERGLHRYYEDHYFDDYARDEMTGYRDPIYRHVMDAIEHEMRPGSLLDVGCGCGFLLKEALMRGWSIMGIDPSVKSLHHADKLLERRLFRDTLDAFTDYETYDVITFINVLDHSASPWTDIQRAGRLLSRGGLLFLRFPNSLFHSTMLRLSSHFMSDAMLRKFLVLHEYSFSPSFIRRLLGDCGFERIEVRNAGLSGGVLLNRIRKTIIAIVMHSLYLASAGRILIGPSLEVTARKQEKTF